MSESNSKKDFFKFLGAFIFILAIVISYSYFSYQNELKEEISLEQYDNVSFYCKSNSLISKECKIITFDKKITNEEYAFLISSMRQKIDDESQRDGLSFKKSL